jgi:hypothetical protein
MRRPKGATVPEVVEATGWLPHTVPGAIASALKRKLGSRSAPTSSRVEAASTASRAEVHRTSGHSGQSPFVRLSILGRDEALQRNATPFGLGETARDCDLIIGDNNVRIRAGCGGAQRTAGATPVAS